MQCDYLPEDLKSIWQELDTNPAPIPLDELRKETGKLRKGLRRRYVLSGGTAAMLVAIWAVFFFTALNIPERIGSVMTVVGLGFLASQLAYLLRPWTVPDMSGIECLRFYRAALERQRSFHQGAWFRARTIAWIGTGWLGMIVWLAGAAEAHPKIAICYWLEIAVWIILAIVRGPGYFKGERQRARRIQRRIDALDRPQRGS